MGGTPTRPLLHFTGSGGGGWWGVLPPGLFSTSRGVGEGDGGGYSHQASSPLHGEWGRGMVGGTPTRPLLHFTGSGGGGWWGVLPPGLFSTSRGVGEGDGGGYSHQASSPLHGEWGRGMVGGTPTRPLLHFTGSGGGGWWGVLPPGLFSTSRGVGEGDGGGYSHQASSPLHGEWGRGMVGGTPTRPLLHFTGSGGGGWWGVLPPGLFSTSRGVGEGDGGGYSHQASSPLHGEWGRGMVGGTPTRPLLHFTGSGGGGWWGVLPPGLFSTSRGVGEGDGGGYSHQASSPLHGEWGRGMVGGTPTRPLLHFTGSGGGGWWGVLPPGLFSTSRGVGEGDGGGYSHQASSPLHGEWGRGMVGGTPTRPLLHFTGSGGGGWWGVLPPGLFSTSRGVGEGDGGGYSHQASSPLHGEWGRGMVGGTPTRPLLHFTGSGGGGWWGVLPPGLFSTSRGVGEGDGGGYSHQASSPLHGEWGRGMVGGTPTRPLLHFTGSGGGGWWGVLPPGLFSTSRGVGEGDGGGYSHQASSPLHGEWGRGMVGGTPTRPLLHFTGSGGGGWWGVLPPGLFSTSRGVGEGDGGGYSHQASSPLHGEWGRGMVGGTPTRPLLHFTGSGGGGWWGVLPPGLFSTSRGVGEGDGGGYSHQASSPLHGEWGRGMVGGTPTRPLLHFTGSGGGGWWGVLPPGLFSTSRGVGEGDGGGYSHQASSPLHGEWGRGMVGGTPTRPLQG